MHGTAIPSPARWDRSRNLPPPETPLRPPQGLVATSPPHPPLPSAAGDLARQRDTLMRTRGTLGAPHTLCCLNSASEAPTPFAVPSEPLTHWGDSGVPEESLQSCNTPCDHATPPSPLLARVRSPTPDRLPRLLGSGAAREGLDASRRILQQMGRRASTNKLVLRAIAGTVLLLLLFLLWPASQAATIAPPPPTSLAVHPKAARHGRQ